MEPEKLLSTKEIADRLGVSSQTIKNYRDEGMPVETKQPLRFKWDDVKEWCNREGK